MKKAILFFLFIYSVKSYSQNLSYGQVAIVPNQSQMSTLGGVNGKLAVAVDSSSIWMYNSGSWIKKVSGSAPFGIFNIVDYGAIGNGTTNNTTVIQNAINAAHVSGGTVYIPHGTYLVDSLVSYNNVLIKGESRFNSILKSNSAHPLITLIVTTPTYIQDGVFFSEFQLNGNSTGTIGLNIQNLARAQVSSLYIHDFTTYGIKAPGSVEVDFNKVTIVSCVTGMLLTSATGLTANLITISDSQIQYCTSWGINYSNGSMLTIKNSDFEHNGTANSLTTGCVYAHNMTTDTYGVGLIIRDTWFEENNGTCVFITASGSQCTSSISNSMLLLPTGTTHTAIKVTGGNNSLILNNTSITPNSSTFVNGLIADTSKVKYISSTFSATNPITLSNGATATDISTASASIVSSAGTLTLSSGSDYSFSGSTSTWTLPAISTINTGRSFRITIKNRGTGNITLNSNSGGNDIYDTSAVSTLSITPGSSISLLPDGTYFNKE